MGKAAKARAASEARPAHGAAPPEDATNGAHHARMLQLVDQITEHPLMKDIRTALPIKRGMVDPLSEKAGYKDVFDGPVMASDLRVAGVAEAACNFFWQNPFPSSIGWRAGEHGQHPYLRGPQLPRALRLPLATDRRNAQHGV